MKGSLFCLSIFWAIGICSAELLAQDRSLNLPAASKTQPENQTTAQIQQTAEAIQTKSLNDEGKTVAPEIGHEQDSMMIIPKSSAPKATNTVTQLENSNPPLGPGQTNSQIIATTQQGLALPETLSCNREMMISYGFKGNLQPLEQPHKYCPSIQQNCCHIDDEEMAMNYWNKNIPTCTSSRSSTCLDSAPKSTCWPEISRRALCFSANERRLTFSQWSSQTSSP